MTPDSTYQPVACALHERLEFAVLRRIPLVLRYFTVDGGVCEASVLAIDVQTREGAEWLKIQREDGSMSELRLDRLLQVAERPHA